MTETVRKSGKSISVSANCGVSLIRSPGSLSAIPSVKKLGSSCSFDLISDSADPEIGKQSATNYKSSVSCGALAGGGSKAMPDAKEKGTSPRSISATTLREKEESEKEQEDPICPDQPLILAAPDGYYGIKISDDHPEYSYIVYLGGQASSPCIVEKIGRIENINLPNFRSNSQPSRWAFEEGVRIHTIPTDTNIYCGMPMIGDAEEDNFTTQFFGDLSYIPHYGYLIGRTMIGGARLGGCAVAGDVAFFAYDSMLISIRETDWVLFDAIMWDYEAHTLGVRWIENLDIKRSCPTVPVYVSGDPQARLTDLLNHERYCVVIVDEVKSGSDARLVAQAYAEKMAEFDFMLHTDPYTNETHIERLNTGEVDFEDAYEVLSQASDPVIPVEDQNPNAKIDAVCDNLWSAWKSSEVHYDGLVHKDRYWIGWGVAQSETTKIWYGCGLIYKKTTDKPSEITSAEIELPTPPVVWKTDNPLNYPTVYYRGKGYRAFSTAPRQEVGISCVTRSLFEGVLAVPQQGGQLVRIKATEAYQVTHSPLEREANGRLIPVLGSALTGPISEHPETLITTGQFIRDDTEQVSFWIQRDNLPLAEGSNYNRDIRVVIDPHVAIMPPLDETIIPKEDYFRTTPLLEEDEDEPEYPYSGSQGGLCKLYIGTQQIDTGDRYNRGPYLDLYQDIMVGSVFFTNSGYTAITYTIPKLLNTTRRGWVDGSDNDVEELYWWVKQEYWAAIIDPSSALIAQWKLGGSPHDFDTENGTYLLQSIERYVDPPTQTFQFQFGGVLKKESAEIRCEIDGDPFVLTDEDGSGVFYEMPNQIPGFETIMSTTEILYNNGVVNLTFGPKRPDTYKNVLAIGSVYETEVYRDFEMFGEVVRYDLTNKLGWSNNYQVSMGGMHPVTPNLTITEDGKYAVFSCKSSSINFSASNRLTYGQSMGSLGNNGYENVYGTSKLQATVFDLGNIVIMEPTRVSDPLFMREQTGDTVILN